MNVASNEMKQMRHKEHDKNIFEEWKANDDLFKFHEDLKQKRFSYFLTIHTAFIALYGIVLKEVLIKDYTFLSLSLI